MDVCDALSGGRGDELTRHVTGKYSPADFEIRIVKLFKATVCTYYLLSFAIIFGKINGE